MPVSFEGGRPKYAGSVVRDGFLRWGVRRQRFGAEMYATEHRTRRGAEKALAVWLSRGWIVGRRV